MDGRFFVCSTMHFMHFRVDIISSLLFWVVARGPEYSKFKSLHLVWLSIKIEVERMRKEERKKRISSKIFVCSLIC